VHWRDPRPRALSISEIDEKIAFWQKRKRETVLHRLDGSLSASGMKATFKKCKIELTVLRRLRFETIKRMKKKLLK